eukprot:SAG25_NODE_667_length_6052_cov_7.366202_5_plen_191_part_00
MAPLVPDASSTPCPHSRRLEDTAAENRVRRREEDNEKTKLTFSTSSTDVLKMPSHGFAPAQLICELVTQNAEKSPSSTNPSRSRSGTIRNSERSSSSCPVWVLALVAAAAAASSAAASSAAAATACLCLSSSARFFSNCSARPFSSSSLLAAASAFFCLSFSAFLASSADIADAPSALAASVSSNASLFF